MAHSSIPECRDCQCPEHNATAALAERKSAWDIANKALTDAVKGWPKHDNEVYASNEIRPPSVDAADVLILAQWLYAGDN